MIQGKLTLFSPRASRSMSLTVVVVVVGVGLVLVDVMHYKFIRFRSVKSR